MRNAFDRPLADVAANSWGGQKQSRTDGLKAFQAVIERAGPNNHGNLG